MRGHFFDRPFHALIFPLWPKDMTLLQLSAQSFARPGSVLDVTQLALPVGTLVTYEWFVDDEEQPRATGPVSYTHLTLPTNREV